MTVCRYNYLPNTANKDTCMASPIDYVYLTLNFTTPLSSYVKRYDSSVHIVLTFVLPSIVICFINCRCILFIINSDILTTHLLHIAVKMCR